MLNSKEVEEELNKFAKYVIQQSRNNLTKGATPYGTYNDTGSLYNSLGHFVDRTANGYALSLEMEDYGKFKDRGVKGKDTSKKAPNSPYRFGSGTGQKGGLTDAMQKYVRRKGIQFRERKKKGEKGRFLSYDQTAFIIARSIYKTGIKSSMFFTTPFLRAFKRLPDDLLKAYSLGIDRQINLTLTKR